MSAAMNAAAPAVEAGDRFPRHAYRPVDVVPPLRAALVIHGQSADGRQGWFAGTFDGARWWSADLPATGTWSVLGWSTPDELARAASQALQSCSCRGPRLRRGDGSAVPSAWAGARRASAAAMPG